MESFDRVSLAGQRRILTRIRDSIVSSVESKQNFMLIEDRYKRLQCVWKDLEKTFEIEKQEDKTDYRYDSKWLSEVYQM